VSDATPRPGAERLARLTAALSDRYTLERELGRGGMATVYLAHDIRHDRTVALKVLHPHLAQELGAERFLVEIRTTARLRHPHILPLFDSGAVPTDGASLLYYVMPFVDGISLRDRLTRERQLPVDDAVRIVAEVCDALDYAHAQGVIHRDIKPENILLEGGHALVADFGIALAGATPGAERITQTGMALGTPAYMSPEQSAGDRDVDGRADLYSVASVLYEMLTGEPPFSGPTVESILVQRFTKAPPRITSRRAGVPRHIDTAVHVAMARDPAERQPAVARFAEALRPPATRAVSGTARSIAVLPFANMSNDAANEYFGDGIAEEIINALAQLPGLSVAARTSAFSFKGKNEDLRTVGEALSVETVLEGSIRKAGNRVRITAQLINVADGFHLWSERYDRELNDIFAIQDEIASAIAAKLKVTLTTGQAAQLVRPLTDNVAAYELLLKARRLVRLRGSSMSEAVACYREAIALDPDFAAAHAGLARALILLAFWGVIHPGTIVDLTRQSAARAMAIDASQPDSIAAGALVAVIFDRDTERSHRLWDSLPPLDPSNADAHVQRAGFDRCYVRGEFDQGIAEIESAIAADPLNAYPVAQLAVLLTFARRHDEALATAEQALLLDPTSTFTNWALLHVYATAGDYQAARAVFDTAVSRVGRGPWFLMGLAIAARHAADRSVADAVFTELKARAQLDYVQATALGASALAADRMDEAIRYLREAAEIRDPLFLAVARHWPALEAARSHPEWPAIIAILEMKGVS
jgi:serine/threonine-protein kinase